MFIVSTWIVGLLAQVVKPFVERICEPNTLAGRVLRRRRGEMPDREFENRIAASKRNDTK